MLEPVSARAGALHCPPSPEYRNLVQPEAATFGPAASAKVRVRSAKPNRILLLVGL